MFDYRFYLIYAWFNSQQVDGYRIRRISFEDTDVIKFRALYFLSVTWYRRMLVSCTSSVFDKQFELLLEHYKKGVWTQKSKLQKDALSQFKRVCISGRTIDHRILGRLTKIFTPTHFICCAYNFVSIGLGFNSVILPRTILYYLFKVTIYPCAVFSRCFLNHWRISG